MELVGVVRCRGRVIDGVVVYIDGPVRVLGGRGVIGVCQTLDEVFGGAGYLGPIYRVLSVVREAAMTVLVECLFQGRYGCGWSDLPLGGYIEGEGGLSWGSVRYFPGGWRRLPSEGCSG